MTTVQDIEKAVSTLPKDKLSEFRSWFDQFDAKEWDHQFKDDVKNGKLDSFAGKAIEDFNNGLCNKL